MTSSDSPGIAILGAGIFAKEAHLPALVALGNRALPLKAVYSRSEKSARELAEAALIALNLKAAPSVYFDENPSVNLDALLARQDIIAVTIALTIPVQPSIILKSLAAGKHVLSEKPIAPDVKTGLEIISTYNRHHRNKGLVWRVAENYEAEPGYRAAAAAIRSGKIGKVIFFKTLAVMYMDQYSKWYNRPWRTVPEYQGGFLLDGGVHNIAALRAILPLPLTHLSAFVSLNKDYLKPYDTIHSIAKAGDSFHGIVEITYASPTQIPPPGDLILVTGTEGWLSVNQIDKPDNKGTILRTIIKSVIKVKDKPDEVKEEVIDVAVDGVVTEFASFFDAINGKDELGLGDPFAALSDVAFIEAALNSHGELVDLAKLLQA